jgi:hypothetical protein
MFWDITGGLIGSFIYAGVVYNVISLLINIATKYKMKRRKNIVISLIVSLVITAILTELIYSWGMVLTGHIPALIILFLYDFFKVNYQKCPHCAEKIKADALKCKHCHSNIGETA